MRRIFLLLGLAGCLFTSAVNAQEFLSGGSQDFVAVLPPPPADDSPAGMADLDTLLQLQKDRTPAQAARAQRVNSQSPFSFARPVLGEWFSSRNLPRTKAIFEEINRESRAIVDEAKRVMHRPRPFARDGRVVPIVGRPGNGSYPSGHTADATVWAAVLTAAFPEHAADFQAQVHETMWGRELAGVHYPTDTESGLTLGTAIAQRMASSPAWGKAIAEIRAEVAAFRQNAPATSQP